MLFRGIGDALILSNLFLLPRGQTMLDPGTGDALILLFSFFTQQALRDGEPESSHRRRGGGWPPRSLQAWPGSNAINLWLFWMSIAAECLCDICALKVLAPNHLILHAQRAIWSLALTRTQP